MSPKSGIYWVELGFINNCKEPQLRLVLLRYSADVASAFPWVVTHLLPLLKVSIPFFIAAQIGEQGSLSTLEAALLLWLQYFIFRTLAHGASPFV